MIDTAAKRRSAACTRRLPWFRRFLPAPDGEIDQGDRQQVAFVYAGILAEEEVTAAPVDAWTAPKRKTEWRAKERSTDWEARKRVVDWKGGER